MISINNIKGTSVAFGSVPAALTTLIDLGTVYTYSDLMIMSSLDTDATLKIGANEIVIPANKNITINNKFYNGIIQYKYVSAPSSGNFAIICA